MLPESTLRKRLVDVVLEWEQTFGIAPSVTGGLAEYDAARLLGCSEDDYKRCLSTQTAVTKGIDFIYNGKKYQVKGNRPSDRPGSTVTLVAQAKKDKNLQKYLWDYLIWVLYDTHYNICEAWLWDAHHYDNLISTKKRVSPQDMRQGKQLL